MKKLQTSQFQIVNESDNQERKLFSYQQRDTAPYRISSKFQIQISLKSNCITNVIYEKKIMKILSCQTIKNNKQSETKLSTMVETLIVNKIKSLQRQQLLYSSKFLEQIQSIQKQLRISQDLKMITLRDEILLGGGNSQSSETIETEKKKERDWLIRQHLNIQEEEENQSCLYVKECIKDLQYLIEQIKNLKSNSKTYCYEKFTNFNSAFFENSECHNSLLEFFEQCAEKLLFQNGNQLVAVENKKEEFLKLIDNYIIILCKFEKDQPLQNHIFYLNLIKQIFQVSKSIQTSMQKITYCAMSLFQVYSVSSSFNKQALGSLLQKCRETFVTYSNCNKIGGIIKYSSDVLVKLGENLGNQLPSFDKSFSFDNSFSSQSTAIYSAKNSLQIDSMPNSLQISNNQQVKQMHPYDIELEVRHQCIDSSSNHRIQYYALMQIDKLIKKMIEDSNYKLDENSLENFNNFIHHPQNGIINFSDRQYWFQSLENISFERHLLLRYISLSILIRCFELFTKKCKHNNNLLEEITQVIYVRFYVESQQKIIILILKNKDLIKKIDNMNNSLASTQMLKDKIDQASKIIHQQPQNVKHIQNHKNSQQDFDYETSTECSETDEQDFKLFKSNIQFIKDSIAQQGEQFIQSRIIQQNYIKHEYNQFKNQDEFYVNQNATEQPEIQVQDILNCLYDKFTDVKPNYKQAFIIQGDSGSGKSTLAYNLYKTLIIKLVNNENNKQISFDNTHKFQTCMPQLKDSTTYIPVLIKLQNMEIQTVDNFIDSLSAEFQTIMKAKESKLLIIDGLNYKNNIILLQALNKLKNEWQNYIFLITCQQQNFQQYSENIIKFINNPGIQNKGFSFKHYELKEFDKDKIKQFMQQTCQKRNKITKMNQNKVEKIKPVEQINQQVQIACQIKDKIAKLQESNLVTNPLNLYMLYKIYFKFYSMSQKDDPITTNSQLNVLYESFFHAQFWFTFQHWSQYSETYKKFFLIFQQSYLEFFKLIAQYMRDHNVNFISIDKAQEDILNKVTNYIENKCEWQQIKFSKANLDQSDKDFVEFYEQFISLMTKYYNLDIFQNIQTKQNNQIQTINIAFKHDRYYEYLLSLQNN